MFAIFTCWNNFDTTNTWEQRKLGDCVQNLSYGIGAAAVPYDGVTRYLRITDIDDDTHQYLADDLSSPSSECELSEAAFLKQGEIVFARTGASVGKTYLNRESSRDIVFAGFLIKASLLTEYDSEFIYQQTLAEDYDRFVATTSQRSGQPGINAQEYADWLLWACSVPEQRQIGAFFRSLDDLITLHQRKQK